MMCSRRIFRVRSSKSKSKCLLETRAFETFLMMADSDRYEFERSDLSKGRVSERTSMGNHMWYDCTEIRVGFGVSTGFSVDREVCGIQAYVVGRRVTMMYES